MTENEHRPPSFQKKRFNPFKNMRLGAKFALMGSAGVLVTAAALLFLAVWQSDRYGDLAQQEVEGLINADLDHIAQGVYNLVKTEDEAIQSHVDANLNVARHVLKSAGRVSLTRDTVHWSATNQFTGDTMAVSLPRLLVGKTWLEQNKDMAIETPIVDEVTRLVGDTVTIFQRMNKRGDMLRVATTVKDSSGNRAIATYIPAVNPGGAANPVISAILNGDTYHGRAYVVNAWYLTAYEPLRDSNGDLVGMLYVGVKQKAVESRIRNAILQTQVGKTGYVYVLGGVGEDRGKYVISNRGRRDGEDIWSNRDSDGRYVIREIIEKAVTLKPGEMTTVRYRWQNPGEPAPRWKIARLAYYKPWDWVIGTSVYEDELQAYRTMLVQGRLRMVQDMAVAGIIITFLVGLASVLVTLKITRPVRQMTRVAEKIIEGDLDQMVEVRSHDDIGILARTFNVMTEKLRRSLESIKESEEKYRLIYENAIEGLFQTSLEGRVISVNPAVATILGYDSSVDLISQITDVGRQVYADPEDRNAIVEKIRTEGKATGAEVQFLRKDGQKTWVSISAHIRHDETGAPAFIEGVITNIDDRKRAEEALAESRNFLMQIINSVPEPMFVKSQHNRWVLVNNAMCDFVGRHRSELVGKNEHNIFEKNEADNFTSVDKHVLTTGNKNIREEKLTDNLGNLHTVIAQKNLYRDKSGEKFIVAIVRDITGQRTTEEEKKALEARLTHAQKMESMGTLAGGIAHDFNNILSAIIGYTELAADDIHQPKKASGHLKQVLKSSDRARDLVKQILTFSRMTETEYAPISIRTVVKESLKMLRSVIPSTIDIRQNLSTSGLVMSDPTQIHQILMNLCTNAAHAMDENGGILEVALEEVALAARAVYHDFELAPGPYLKLTIRDTGCGISPAIMDKIFEPYFTTKEQDRGTGLGLSVIHGIIKNHNGAITCQSTVNEGTTFEVFLPLIKSNSPKPASGGKKSMPVGSERILYVDDENIITDMAERMLGNRGYSVVSRTVSLDALELFRADPHAFDLVITDMTMPGMTGNRLASEILAIRGDIPIILCTGYSEHISEVQAMDIGIKAFIFKPLDMRTLTETVRNVLDDSG
jgi:PAS domain S-box-containing protein